MQQTSEGWKAKKRMNFTGRKSGHSSLRANSINFESSTNIIKWIKPNKSSLSDHAVLLYNIMFLYSIYSSVICRLTEGKKKKSHVS
jgi:hypothetical protein